MVVSGSLTGALLERRLFDQGIVGVFPENSAIMMFLLGFFNSSIATKVLRDINPTANNSVNYLKRLPVVVPSRDELHVIHKEVTRAVLAVRRYGVVPVDLAQRLDEWYGELWQS